MIEIVGGIVTTVLAVWLAGIEVRMRKLDERLRDVPTRQEVSSEIEVRQESVKVLQQEIKEDIKEMRRSLEQLLKNSK